MLCLEFRTKNTLQERLDLTQVSAVLFLWDFLILKINFVRKHCLVISRLLIKLRLYDPTNQFCFIIESCPLNQDCNVLPTQLTVNV